MKKVLLVAMGAGLVTLSLQAQKSEGNPFAVWGIRLMCLHLARIRSFMIRRWLWR